MRKSVRKRISLLLVFILAMGLLSGCTEAPKEDYSFQKLFSDCWGKTEEEFLELYPMDTEVWERTEGTRRDFRQQKHNCISYKSVDAVEFAGFPCEMEIAFTENFGMTNLYYVIKQENLSREDYYQTLFSLYHELYDFFGEPGWPSNEISDDTHYWYDYDNIDEFFDYLNRKAKRQNVGEIFVSWGKVADEYPITMVQLTSYSAIPFEDESMMSLQLQIMRDVTEGAQ